MSSGDDQLSDDAAREFRKLGYPENFIAGLRGKQQQQLAPRMQLKYKTKEKPKRLPAVIEWRNAFCAVRDTSRATGLPSTTRLVLWTISRFMDGDGTGAHPGLERIAKDAGLSLPAVKLHIEIAAERGWLRRKRNHKTRYGIGYEYIAAIPEGATSLPGKHTTGKRDAAKGATSVE